MARGELCCTLLHCSVSCLTPSFCGCLDFCLFRVILLDTEGLYSPHVPANYDAKIFALALIFSSTLVYNELGVLNQQSVDRFQYLTVRLMCYFGLITCVGEQSL
jgi:hypothetical protein